jgi:shikimate 5-dehydrogenase
MKLVVTIYEETAEQAVETVRAVEDRMGQMGLMGPTGQMGGGDPLVPSVPFLFEIRAERFPSLDLAALRQATDKPLILTYRGSRVPDVQQALAAGIDFVDVEWHDGVAIEAPGRTVLSHHDYDGMHDVERIMEKMRERGCAYTKLAATPQSFEDNRRLLSLLPGSVIGMGERGIYSRILAPFLGSELSFVAATNLAALGQLTLDRALDIYGPAPQRGDKIFAVVGNPASHSLSPSIHNRLFRERRVPAAYTIASVERFAEVADAFLSGELSGLSVTAPFKDDAFHFARARNFDLGEHALRARAVNTLVNVNGRYLADNTDVDGFAALLPSWLTCAAVIGAGGTGRAARVALANAGVPAITFNRTAEKGDAPLPALAIYDGDCIINTLPPGTGIAIPPCRVYIEAAYGGSPADVTAEQRIGGLELLHAQATRQHELFMKVFHGI